METWQILKVYMYTFDQDTKHTGGWENTPTVLQKPWGAAKRFPNATLVFSQILVCLDEGYK